MSGKVISFINMKGGVGKTTLCIGIGEYLATYLHKKILFIDLDPQFNTTQSMMNLFNLEDEYLSNYKNIKTVQRFFENPTKISDKPKMPEASELIIELNDNMHIIAGTIDLILADNNKSSATSRRVNKFICDNGLRNKYDFIFIDCPPTISLYTDSALIASDLYLVPNRLDRYSILGIKLLNQVISRLTYEEGLQIKCLGIVYTMMGQITEKEKRIKVTLEKDEIVKTLGTFKNNTSFVNDLRVGLQGNIASKYKRSRDDIKNVCSEFLERVRNNG